MLLTRRRFFQLTIAGGIATAGYTWKIEPYWIAYQNVDMPIPHLPDSLVGKTCIQLSDLHIGTRVDEGYLLRQFEYVESLKPDFVFYTGDFVDFADKPHFALMDRIISKAPRGLIGTAGVLGNHDYPHISTQAPITRRIEGRLNDVGINILRDSTIQLGDLRVAGLEDFWSSQFRIETARDAILDTGNEKPSIVLSHNPDTADLNIWRGFKGWILCGHTHGGQCVFPLVGAPIVPVQNRDYVSGLFKLDQNRKMYVNRGVGHTFPARFCARPEITVFRMMKA